MIANLLTQEANIFNRTSYIYNNSVYRADRVLKSMRYCRSIPCGRIRQEEMGGCTIRQVYNVRP